MVLTEIIHSPNKVLFKMTRKKVSTTIGETTYRLYRNRY